MVNQIIGAVELGLVYGLMVLGVFITFRILKIPDLTVDGSVEKEIQTMTFTSPNKETGGCLFGSYDRNHNSIYSRLMCRICNRIFPDKNTYTAYTRRYTHYERSLFHKS